MDTQTTTMTEHGARDDVAARWRSCVGCGKRVASETGAAELVRLVRRLGGDIAVDLGGDASGRGAHVHPRRACLEKACSRGLARSFRARVDTLEGEDGPEPLEPNALARSIRAAFDRRIRDLLIAAVRQRQIAFGADAVAVPRQRAQAVVVACDDAATAALAEVRGAVDEGRAVAWGTSALFASISSAGASTASGGLGLMAISSPSIARAVRDAARAAEACGVVSVNAVERGA